MIKSYYEQLLFGQLSEMKLINNITDLFGDDLKQTLSSGAHLKIAASCFSIYAFEALKDELEKIRVKKLEDKGGFAKNLFLIDTSQS